MNITQMKVVIVKSNSQGHPTARFGGITVREAVPESGQMTYILCGKTVPRDCSAITIR